MGLPEKTRALYRTDKYKKALERKRGVCKKYLETRTIAPSDLVHFCEVYNRVWNEYANFARPIDLIRVGM